MLHHEQSFGENNMELLDVIRDLDSFEQEAIICAGKPWTENSPAIVVAEGRPRGIPTEARRLGMDYFLEIFIARELLEDWTRTLDTEPTLQAKCARVIRYAITDA